MCKEIIPFKKIVSLFLSFVMFFHPFTATWGMQNNEEDTAQVVQRLQDEIEKITNITSADPNFSERNKRVIFIGPSKSGKSTIITGLARRPLHVVEQRARNFRIGTDRPLPNIRIDHTINPGTRMPASWYDEAGGIVYWDCPGFGDIRGAGADILNAFAIHQLFNNALVHIILVIPEDYILRNYRFFYDILNDIGQSLSETPNLPNIMSLIVTQVERGDVCDGLSELFTQEESARTGGEERSLSNEGYNLLNFFAQGAQNQGRVVYSIPYPTQPGQYPFDEHRRCILEMIREDTFIENPIIVHNINDGSQLYVQKLAKKLNKEITESMNQAVSEGTRSLLHNRMLAHDGSAASLRTTFRDLINGLKLPDNASMDDVLAFIGQFESALEVPNSLRALRQSIENMIFLERVAPTDKNYAENWIPILKRIIDTEQQNTVSELVQKLEDGCVTLSGFVLGTSDINNVLREKDGQFSIEKVIVDGQYIFIDQDIQLYGLNLTFKAPFWKTIGKRFINLNGKPGEAAGENGKSAGNFEGLNNHLFMDKDKDGLTISVNGGDGADGKDGEDGKIDDIKNRVKDSLISRKAYTNQTMRDFFINRGVKLIFTSNSQFIEIYERQGGIGQAGGSGGEAGTCTIKQHCDDNNGISFYRGEDGQRGRKGKTGQTCRGVYFAEYVLPALQGVTETEEGSIKLKKVFNKEAAIAEVTKIALKGKSIGTNILCSKISSYFSSDWMIEPYYFLNDKESTKNAVDDLI